MANWVYKIARGAEWDEMRRTGRFTGSEDDRRDGFIHLSAAHQLRATFDKYFRNETKLLLVTLDQGRLQPGLKWETSRGGQEFPHLYGSLPADSVHSAVPIERGADGRPIFPPEIP